MRRSTKTDEAEARAALVALRWTAAKLGRMAGVSEAIAQQWLDGAPLPPVVAASLTRLASA